MGTPQDTAGAWELDPHAAAALVAHDPPFSDERFLRALAALPEPYAVVRVGAVNQDGSRASIAVAARDARGTSVPYGYGGIVAERSLEEDEVLALLRLAAAHAHVHELRSAYVPLPVRGRSAHAGGRVIASTAVVVIEGLGDDVQGRLAKKARQSIRRAERAGVSVTASENPAAFLAIYARAAQRFATVYPSGLLRHLAGSGLGWAYEARIGEEPVAAAFVLRGSTEWMYWLAAETDRGRGAEAGYPLVARVLADARDASVAFVNLGASSHLPGVAQFKRRLASIDLPVIEHAVSLSRLPAPARRLLHHPAVERVLQGARRAQDGRLAWRR